jgi:hypothetical protein
LTENSRVLQVNFQQPAGFCIYIPSFQSCGFPLRTIYHTMESPYLKSAPSPGAPLYAISPERFNQQRMNASPRASVELSPSHQKATRNAPDIRSKVAYFTNLSRENSPAPPASATTVAALQRAILGREEAEAALNATYAQLSESNARERRVSERLEALMEELQSLKQKQTHERSIYEKEVRKARKEAFRAGSTLVKAQEELKYLRGQVKSLKDGMQAEKEAKEKAEQEAFERAYALAGVTEELELMRENVRSAQKDKSEILEVQAGELQTDTPTRMVHARSGSTTPVPRSLKRSQPDSVDQKSPTRKRVFSGQPRLSPSIDSPVKLHPSPARRSAVSMMGSEQVQDEQNVAETLKYELRWEKHLRSRAEDMVNFLKMECQFKRCSCRIAESRGVDYIHDYEWAADHPPQLRIKPVSRPSQSYSESRSTPAIVAPLPTVNPEPEPQGPPQIEPEQQISVYHQDEGNTMPEESVIMTFCPDTGTFRSLPSPSRKPAPSESQPTILHEKPEPLQLQPEPIPSVPRPSEPSYSDALERMSISEDARLAHLPAAQQPNPPDSAIAVYAAPPALLPLHIPAKESFVKETTPVNQTNIISTTLTIPLQPENISREASCPVPATPISREDALAQIRARRGRAQQQTALKRSASANDASARPRTVMTPLTGSRRAPRVENSGLRSRPSSRRDISAPAGKC